jgi:rhodanese-related sulfurtransferase
MNASALLFIFAILALLLALKHVGRARADLVRARAANGALVVDVRTRSEYDEGHLPNALNIPLHEIKERIAEFAPDKNQPLLLHCASGARSEAAKRILRGMGYRNVHNVGSYARARALLARD